MDTPPMDPNAEDQLRKYREEQRRRHEQVSHESARGYSGYVPTYTPSPIQPSAPPLMSEERSLYPIITPSKNTNTLKTSQEEEDERLARQLQQDEENTTIPTHHNNTPPSPIPNREVPDTEDDEQLALALQESEQFQQPQDQSSPPQSAQPSGILSTLGTIGRGLYNAYTTYSQTHQQAQQDAEQQAQHYNADALQRRQLDNDEALARRIQEEEEANAQSEGQQQMRPTRRPPIQFVYRHPPAASHLSPFGYDSDDDESHESLESPHANPWDQLRTLNSLFRSTGAAPDEPLFGHLQELMRQTRYPTRYEEGLPTHRYVFPRSAFHAQGVEELPPGLLNMMQGESDTSYESLLELAERMQPVSRGASDAQIDQLPTRIFAEGSMPSEHSKCGICLADYAAGEELTSLPCLHSFHKECISHWLGINKICPVCRVEIAGQPS